MLETNQKQLKQKCQGVFGRLLPYLLTALISAVIVIIAFKKRGIAPFGENSVLCMDLWGQYFPMYVNNKEAESLSGLLYSWNGALGFNNWAQSAYYCNSVFVFLFKFIPYHLLVKALDIFCLIKIILSSVSCLAYMHYKFKRRSPILIAGAVSYSVCAYMLAFISQFMWTDSLFLAPLVLIGIERLVYKKKPLMYTLVLAVSIMSSFYIGFAMCIFSVLYFAVSSVLLMKLSIADRRLRLEGTKEFKFSVIRFGVFSLLAGAISAVVILPVGLAISKTIASEASAPDKFEWYGNFASVLRNMLPGMRLFEEYEGANIFCGILAFLAVPAYFMNRKIRLAERIANAAILVFLIMSLDCNVLDYMWHGFHFPNQLPGRWTFLFSLFVIMIGCKGILHYDKLTPSRAIAGCASGIMLFYVISQGIGDTPKYDLPAGSWGKLFVITAFILIGVFAAHFLRDGFKEEKEEESELSESPEPNRAIEFIKKCISNKSVIILACTTAIAFVAVFDSANHFIKVSQYEDSMGMQVSPEVSYTDQVERASRNGQVWKSGDDEFYRVEANNGFTFNCSMIGDYHGIRYYSSTMNGDIYNFLKYMGNRVYADKVSSVYTLSSPVQNSIFGLKYFMDFDRYLDSVVPGTVIVEENEDGLFRENTTALPLAYAVSDDILNFKVKDEVHALKNQNDLLNMMCGEEINAFKKLDCTSFTTENVTLDSSDDWNTNYFYTDSGQRQAIFHYSYIVDESGYIFFEHNFRAGSLHVTAPNIDKTIANGDGLFAYLGWVSAGDMVNIDVAIEDVWIGCYGLDVYSFDELAWDYAFRKLAAQGIQVTSFQNTKVDGNISLNGNSLVFTSVPDDGGWKVYCDGEEVPVERVCDSLVAMRIPQGDHEISLRYHVPGFKAGLIVSILGLALSLMTVCYERIKNVRRKRECA